MKTVPAKLLLATAVRALAVPVRIGPAPFNGGRGDAPGFARVSARNPDARHVAPFASEPAASPPLSGDATAADGLVPYRPAQ
jgi:hypothetical protein